MASVIAKMDLAELIAPCISRGVLKIALRTKDTVPVSKALAYAKMASAAAHVRFTLAQQIAVVMECARWGVKGLADAHRAGTGKTALAATNA